MKHIALAAALALGLSACASTSSDYRPYSYDSGYDYNQGRNYDHGDYQHRGVVERVRWVEDRQVRGGAVVGAIVGGLIGSQIGDGRGQTAATVGGAVAGGVIGHNVDKNNRPYRQAIDIRLGGGGFMTVVQDGNPRFYEGQRVRVVGTGNKARVVAD